MYGVCEMYYAVCMVCCVCEGVLYGVCVACMWYECTRCVYGVYYIVYLCVCELNRISRSIHSCHGRAL